MKTIEDLRYELKLNKQNLAERRRVFLAECDKELEMLMKMEKWLNIIEKEMEREAKHGED